MYPCFFFHLDDRMFDIVCWKDDPKGIFSIHSVWNSIRPL
jgi:hypothetical protein